MICRCQWANGDELSAKYHDEEWGDISHDDRHIFEMLSLEGAEAGLSWLTILKKRENYIKAFDNFDVHKIIKYNDKKVEELLNNPGIVRSRLKILSVIKNAKVFIEMQKEFGSFSNYLWAFVDNTPIVNDIKTIKDTPSKSELSEKISKDLKKRGMSFVGPTIIYSLMQDIGMVNDHENSCFKK